MNLALVATAVGITAGLSLGWWLSRPVALSATDHAQISREVAQEMAALDVMLAERRAKRDGESTTEMPPNPGVRPEDPRLSTKESER